MPLTSRQPIAVGKLIALIVALVSVGPLSACSSGSSPTLAADTSFQQVVANQLAKADLDEDTRARIQAAGESGVMTFEDYKQGFEPYIECRAANGVEVATYSSEYYGVLTIFIAERFYEDELPDGYIEQAYECAGKSIHPLEGVYNAQASSVVAQQQYAQRFIGPMRECLEPFGAKIPDDATVYDMVNLEAEIMPDSATLCSVTTGMYSEPRVPENLWGDE